MYDFDRVVERRGSDALKWDKYAGRDVIPMWVADMDFMCPEPVVQALRDRVDHGIFGYGLPPAELITVLEKRFADVYGWPIEPDWIVWLPGVVPGLTTVCTAFAETGDDIATFTPIYPPFLGVPETCGRRLLSIPLARRDGRYTIDAETFAAALTPRTRVLLLCQPHNPVGRVFEAGELMPVIEICLERNIVICSDEIHCDLILARTVHRPAASLSRDAAQSTVTLMSPGKTFNTAGLNTAFAVIPNRHLHRAFSKARRYALPYPNVLGYTAALAAYRDCETWRSEMIGKLRTNAEYLYRVINDEMPGLSMAPVEATYLAWIDARGLANDDPHLLFRQQGVALSDGKEFGAPGFVRLNFGCPMQLLHEGIGRIRRGCESMP